MGRLVDYFTCDVPLLEEWSAAVATQDARRQEASESAMPALLTFQNLDCNAFVLLVQTARARQGDSAELSPGTGLVRCFSEQGPWLLRLELWLVAALAEISPCNETLTRWRYAYMRLHGLEHDYIDQSKMAEDARLLKALCQRALAEQFDLYCCVPAP